MAIQETSCRGNSRKGKTIRAMLWKGVIRMVAMIVRKFLNHIQGGEREIGPLLQSANQHPRKMSEL